MPGESSRENTKTAGAEAFVSLLVEAAKQQGPAPDPV
jgi:hypothetical protein